MLELNATVFLKWFWNRKSLYDNYRMNAINLQRLRFNMKKFNCINDNLSHKDIEGSVENKLLTGWWIVWSTWPGQVWYFSILEIFNQIRFLGDISFRSTILWRLLPKQKSIWNINFIPLQLFYSVPNCVSGLSGREYHGRRAGDKIGSHDVIYNDGRLWLLFTCFYAEREKFNSWISGLRSKCLACLTR